MFSIFEKLLGNELQSNKILIRHRNFSIKYKDIFKSEDIDLDKIKEGNVVALIGDYDGFTIKTFLKLIDKKLYSHGGRVLNVSSLGESIDDCRKKIYNAIAKIKFEACCYRKDIGLRKFKF